jgi:hypothetical protein
VSARGGSRGDWGSWRRGPPQEVTICTREGCSRPRPHNREFPYCSLVCRAVVERLENTETLCRELGPTEESVAVWLAAVALNDGVTALYEAQKRALRVQRQARAEGVAS